MHCNHCGKPTRTSRKGGVNGKHDLIFTIPPLSRNKDVKTGSKRINKLVDKLTKSFVKTPPLLINDLETASKNINALADKLPKTKRR